MLKTLRKHWDLALIAIILLAAVAFTGFVLHELSRSIQLRPGRKVDFAWTVLDARGLPLSGVQVVAQIDEDSGVREQQTPKRRQILTETDAHGRISFQGPVFRMRLKLEKSGYATKQFNFFPRFQRGMDKRTVCLVETPPPYVADDLDLLGARNFEEFGAGKNGEITSPEARLGEKRGVDFDSAIVPPLLAPGDERVDMVLEFQRDSLVLHFPNGVGAKQPCIDPYLINVEASARLAPQQGYTSSLIEPPTVPNDAVFVIKQADRYIRVALTWFWRGQTPPRGSSDTAPYLLRATYIMSRDGHFLM